MSTFDDFLAFDLGWKIGGAAVVFVLTVIALVVIMVLIMRQKQPST